MEIKKLCHGLKKCDFSRDKSNFQICLGHTLNANEDNVRPNTYASPRIIHTGRDVEIVTLDCRERYLQQICECTVITTHL